jgi:hypothetical protein
MRRIVGLFLIVALTIIATLAESFRNGLWTSYHNYNSPYASDLPASGPRASPSARVVMVLVRGLRLDTSRKMEAINTLRKQGADVVVQGEPPTYRLPALETLLTGASPETHGVTTNDRSQPGAASTLFRQIQLAGDTAAIIGSQELIDAFGDDAQRVEVLDDPDPAQRDVDAVRIGLDILRDPSRQMQLVCIELGEIETSEPAGAQEGDAVALTDERIKALVDSIDLKTNTVVVMADRGITRRGSDGGNESEVAMTPLAMAGAGVASGAQYLIRAVDVAPTLAALVGAPMPVHAQGQVALPLLAPVDEATIEPAAGNTEVTSDTLAPGAALMWASAAQLTTFYESWSEKIRQPRFAAELLREHQGGIKSGSADEYQKFVTDLRSKANAAYSARLDAERAQRIPIVIGAGIFIIALIGLALSSHATLAVAGAALYATLWYALYFVLRDNRFSLSMFTGSDPTAFLNGLARDSAILMVAVSAFVAVLTRHHEDALDAVTTVLSSVLLIVCVQLVLTTWFFFQWGDTFTWYLPESSAFVAGLAALTQTSALSLRIVPELPNVPMSLVIALVTFAVFTLVRERARAGGYGRLR